MFHFVVTANFFLFHDGAQLFHKNLLNLSRFLLEIQKTSAKLTVHNLPRALICDQSNETIISNVSLRTDIFVLFHNEAKLFCKTDLNPYTSLISREFFLKFRK